MTVLTNRITIAAARPAVWKTLTTLELLETYDPGVRSSRVTGEVATGPGAERRCDLRPAGWFVERVVAWQPEQALAFELVTCSLPVAHLRHDYTLTAQDGGTVVTQVMTYELKYGPAGRLLDAVMMRRQWDQGIKGFLAGLKQTVEHQPALG
jgi:ligand-binding SRPBCC domain-containing protein